MIKRNRFVIGIVVGLVLTLVSASAASPFPANWVVGMTWTNSAGVFCESPSAVVPAPIITNTFLKIYRVDRIATNLVTIHLEEPGWQNGFFEMHFCETNHAFQSVMLGTGKTIDQATIPGDAHWLPDLGSKQLGVTGYPLFPVANTNETRTISTNRWLLTQAITFTTNVAGTVAAKVVLRWNDPTSNLEWVTEQSWVAGIPWFTNAVEYVTNKSGGSYFFLNAREVRVQ